MRHTWNVNDERMRQEREREEMKVKMKYIAGIPGGGVGRLIEWIEVEHE